MCGLYIMLELACENFDFAMSWYERRLLIFEVLIEQSFSTEEKEIVALDENGRELPEWLKKAEEKEFLERTIALPEYSVLKVLCNYSIHYGLKAYMLHEFYYAQK